MLSTNPIEGCTQAHKQIVQWAKDNDEPAVWILEDDVMFTAPGAAEYFLENIPFHMQYEVYTAGVYGTHKFWHRGHFYNWLKTMSGTHCYIVNSSFYDRFLSLDDSTHLDVTISNECKEGELVMPSLTCALQIPGFSDILNQQVDYNNEKYLWQYELFKGEKV